MLKDLIKDFKNVEVSPYMVDIRDVLNALQDLDEVVPNIPDGHDWVWGDNTYNSGGHISHDLNFRAYEYKGNTYVEVKVHIGTDIRAGYTEPIFFKNSVDEVLQTIAECYQHDAVGNWNISTSPFSDVYDIWNSETGEERYDVYDIDEFLEEVNDEEANS